MLYDNGPSLGTLRRVCRSLNRNQAPETGARSSKAVEERAVLSTRYRVNLDRNCEGVLAELALTTSSSVQMY